MHACNMTMRKSDRFSVCLAAGGGKWGGGGGGLVSIFTPTASHFLGYRTLRLLAPISKLIFVASFQGMKIRT